ncbi:MAG: hypothetical protein M0027_08580 [Candidatus Dormibacteraeota bacterium]|nr:hypothetical protein [Candidatus Dormibacteraeota bacterium]
MSPATGFAFDPAAIDTSGAVTLVVAQRSGRNFKGHRIAMNKDVADELRAICQATLTAIAERTAMEYADDLDYDGASHYVLVPSAALVAHRPEPRRGRRSASAPAEPPQVEVDPGAGMVLAAASSLPQLNARDLKKQSFAFYAAVVGDNPDSRVAFVDRWNPYKAGLSGRLLTNFGDRLTRIEPPVLVFERSFDMVVTDMAIAVLDVSAFEAVFRDIDTMTARFSVWSQAAVTALPLDGDTAQRLCALCDRGGRVAKQLRGMYERRAFGSKFTIPALRAEMQKQNLDDNRLLQNDQLVLQDDDIPIMLKLIDEKLYTGWSTNKRWDVGTRSER